MSCLTSHGFVFTCHAPARRHEILVLFLFFFLKGTAYIALFVIFPHVRWCSTWLIHICSMMIMVIPKMKCCHTLFVLLLCFLPAACQDDQSSPAPELPPPNSVCGTGSIKSTKCERLNTRKDVSRRWNNIVSWSLVLSITRYISWELNGGWRRFMRSGMSPSLWGSQPRQASCHLQCTVIVQFSVCVCVCVLAGSVPTGLTSLKEGRESGKWEINEKRQVWTPPPSLTHTCLHLMEVLWWCVCVWPPIPGYNPLSSYHSPPSECSHQLIAHF